MPPPTTNDVPDLPSATMVDLASPEELAELTRMFHELCDLHEDGADGSLVSTMQGSERIRPSVR